MRWTARSTVLVVVSTMAVFLPALVLSGSAASAVPITCTGNIQVTNTDNNTVAGFVSNAWNSFGEYVVTTTSANYLSVSVPVAATVNITATNPQSASFPLVGGIVGFSSSSANLGVGSFNYAYLGGVTSTPPNGPAMAGPNSFTAATGIAEGIESPIWTVGTNSLLTPQWVNTDNSLPATHLVDIGGILVVTGDTTAFGNAFGPFSDVALNVVPSCGKPTTTTVASSPNPSLPGQSVTFTATVAGSDGGGTIAFADGSTPIASCGSVALAAAGANFKATCTISTVSAGDVITAAYSGDPVSNPSSGTVTQRLFLPITVTGSQTFGGTPTFSTTETLPAGITTSGSVSCSTVNGGTPISPSLTAGSYTIDGSSCAGILLAGAGSGNYVVTYTGRAFKVNSVTPVITWPNPASIVYGTALSSTQLDATANVAGTFVYSPPAGTVLHAGANQPLTATFTPSDKTDYSTATKTVDITVTKATLTVTAHNASRNFGQPNPTFTVTNSGFVNGDTSASLGGTLTFTTTAVLASAPGTYSVTPGGLTSTDYTISFVAGTLTVTKAPTITTVAVSPPAPGVNQAVTFTATVAPNPATAAATPSGTVSFFVGGSATPAATVTLAGGRASFVTDFGGGSHIVTAVYSGDADFLTSTSAAGTTTVGCSATITGSHGPVQATSGTTCISNATITGAVVASTGAIVDIENSTVSGSISATGVAGVRICGTTTQGPVTIAGSIGFVLIGDTGEGCAPNTIGASLVIERNTHGLVVVGNTINGKLIQAGNSGAGPLPGQTGPIVEDNT